jgi:hypothetical protein
VIIAAMLCASHGVAAAQSADDLRQAVDEARGAAKAAREASELALKAMKDAKNAQVLAEAARDAAQKAPANNAAAEAEQSIFDKLQFLGNANLIAGSLTTEEGETIASGGVGVYAETKRWSLVTSFTFGSEGKTEESSTRADYVAFLHSPTSAVGGQVQVRFLQPIKTGVFRLGGSVTTRVNAIDFSFGDGSKESIKLLAIDPALAVSVLFSKKQDITFVGEVGLGLRFWNKPGQAFRDALMLPDDSHSYAGIRVLGALAVSNIYVGVEVTRYGGGQLSDLEEFAIIPYVGLRGGLDIIEKPAGDDDKDGPSPPATPLM